MVRATVEFVKLVSLLSVAAPSHRLGRADARVVKGKVGLDALNARVWLAVRLCK